MVATDLVAAADVAPGELDHGAIAYRQLDVTHPVGWAHLAAELRTRYGQVHGLVNNAGVGDLAGLLEVQLGDWERTFRVNTTGPLLGIQAIVPLMAPGASIVTIGSVAALTPNFTAAYTASKWAVRGLARGGQPRTRTARHPLQPDPSRLHRDRHGGRRSAGVPAGAARRQSPRHPRRAGRRGAPGRLPDQRRVPVRLRRGDRRRRRVHRTGRRQVALRRRPCGRRPAACATPAPDGCSARRLPTRSTTGTRRDRKEQP